MYLCVTVHGQAFPELKMPYDTVVAAELLLTFRCGNVTIKKGFYIKWYRVISYKFERNLEKNGEV